MYITHSLARDDLAVLYDRPRTKLDKKEIYIYMYLYAHKKPDCNYDADASSHHPIRLKEGLSLRAPRPVAINYITLIGGL